MTAQLALLAELMGVVAVTMLLGISPRFRFRPLAFKYPRREALISLSLVALLAAGMWLLYSNLTVTLPAAPRTFVYPTDQLLRQVMIALIILAPFVGALLMRGQPWRSAGLGRQTLNAGLQLGLALALITVFLRGKIYDIMGGLSGSEALLLVALLAIGFSEEFAFRGYVQPRLSSWLGDRAGWVSTAVIFVLWSIPEQVLVLKATSLAALGVNLLDLLAFALVQGWVMRKCGNILAPVLFNAIHRWAMYI